MRSLWSGHILFGTIFIPVRLYAASQNLHVNFHLVHKSDCGRVRYKKVCEKDGKELRSDEIVKAFILAGECLKFTDRELEALKPAATRTMSIEGFCDFSEIPVVALSKPYYLGTESPTRGGVGQSFLLLKKAMEKMDKVAVVKWVARSNEYLGVLIPYQNGFLLKQLLYQEQIRPTEDMEVIQADISPDLIDKGAQVVAKMIIDFNWEEYYENYSKEVKNLIEKKSLGLEVDVPEYKPPEVRSLEAELEKMLAAEE